jgi:hypothetical protein
LATVNGDHHMVFIIAACRARCRGTRFTLKNPPAHTERELHDDQLGNLVEICSRPAPPAPAAQIPERLSPEE